MAPFQSGAVGGSLFSKLKSLPVIANKQVLLHSRQEVIIFDNTEESPKFPAPRFIFRLTSFPTRHKQAVVIYNTVIIVIWFFFILAQCCITLSLWTAVLYCAILLSLVCIPLLSSVYYSILHGLILAAPGSWVWSQNSRARLWIHDDSNKAVSENERVREIHTGVLQLEIILLACLGMQSCRF